MVTCINENFKNNKTSHKFVKKITYITQGVYIIKKTKLGLVRAQKYF